MHSLGTVDSYYTRGSTTPRRLSRREAEEVLDRVFQPSSMSGLGECGPLVRGMLVSFIERSALGADRIEVSSLTCRHQHTNKVLLHASTPEERRVSFEIYFQGKTQCVRVSLCLSVRAVDVRDELLRGVNAVLTILSSSDDTEVHASARMVRGGNSKTISGGDILVCAYKKFGGQIFLREDLISELCVQYPQIDESAIRSRVATLTGDKHFVREGTLSRKRGTIINLRLSEKGISSARKIASVSE